MQVVWIDPTHLCWHGLSRKQPSAFLLSVSFQFLLAGISHLGHPKPIHSTTTLNHLCHQPLQSSGITSLHLDTSGPVSKVHTAIYKHLKSCSRTCLDCSSSRRFEISISSTSPVCKSCCKEVVSVANRILALRLWAY